jgi:sorbitol-specific phosphotransferase system component IIC
MSIVFIILSWLLVLLLIVFFIINLLEEKELKNYDNKLKYMPITLYLILILISFCLLVNITCDFSRERKIRKDLEKKQTIEYFENIPDTLASLWKINKYTNEKELIFSITKN